MAAAVRLLGVTMGGSSAKAPVRVSQQKVRGDQTPWETPPTKNKNGPVDVIEKPCQSTSGSGDKLPSLPPAFFVLVPSLPLLLPAA
mmetsp:Transcript_54132/g.101088  ORF Transcript_54132/g.101088 Transcript_54132/m.101088 type:complete len:86 (+) Transcript_54132:198-455(+)